MTDDELLEQLAETGFIAYGNAVGWIAVSGEQMPMWHQVAGRIRHAWKAATAKIVADLLHQPDPKVTDDTVVMNRAAAPVGFAAALDLTAQEFRDRHRLDTAAAVSVPQHEEGTPVGGFLVVGPDGKLEHKTTQAARLQREAAAPDGGMTPAQLADVEAEGHFSGTPLPTRPDVEG